jgi:hypothetical protein
MENKQQEEVPKWMNFICPSCSIVYGTYDIDIKK